MLNGVWITLFLSALACGGYRWLALGDSGVFAAMTTALFSQAKTAFELCLALSGIMSFWLGLLHIAEHCGAVKLLSRGLNPLFRRLMPEVPTDHPAQAAIVMNIAANLLGLDNAATPLGIKAMQGLQSLNPHPERASNAQILFLVMNTSCVSLFPISIFAYRAQFGAVNPTDVFIPILLATYMSAICGLLLVAFMQNIRLFDRVILAYLGGLSAVVLGLATYFSQLSQTDMQQQSALLSHLLLSGMIVSFIATAAWQRLNVYQLFINGAAQGFQTAITIAPYLVAMLTAFGMFRASGALDVCTLAIRAITDWLQIDNRFIDVLPTALLKPFSGSGARAMMIDTLRSHGADSFVGRMACVVQGSTETTFYVLAVYFGAAGITRVRHAAICGLFADAVGIVSAIIITYWFFA